MFKGGQQRQRALPTQITDQPGQAGRHPAGLQIDQIHLRRDVGQQGGIVGSDEYQVHIEPSGSDPSAQIDRHPLRSAVAYGWQEKSDLSRGIHSVLVHSVSYSMPATGSPGMEMEYLARWQRATLTGYRQTGG